MRKREKSYHLIIPEKLLPVIIEIEKNPPRIYGFSKDRLLYLISVILSNKQKDHSCSYSMLNMKYLTNVVPLAGEYMYYLKSIGVVEWKNHLKSRNSRLYRMTLDYRGVTIWRTLTDQKLARRICENEKSLKFRNSKKYPHLNKFVHMIEIDLERALKTIQETYEHNLKSNIQEVQKKAESRMTFSVGEVLKIHHGQIYIRVNKTNLRYDTNFTRLPSELVKHLHINGSYLQELDIANSQPFFVNALFNPTQEVRKIVGESLYMYTSSHQLNDKEDVILYKSLTSQGRFYDFLEDKCNKAGLRFRDRRDFKDHVFLVFFGKNQAFKYSKLVQLFEELFPSIWRFFTVIKSPRHNKLAILLQRIESYTMLEKVAHKINNQFPSLPFLTKHDSILIPTRKDILLLKELELIILETIKDTVGSVPKIRTKNTI
ncbi:MAG: hypothetical protein JXB49_33960 [Bacteroidales bacterium]|nr:hypothetical protein [Bacteroidales bacterium]